MRLLSISSTSPYRILLKKPTVTEPSDHFSVLAPPKHRINTILKASAQCLEYKGSSVYRSYSYLQRDSSSKSKNWRLILKSESQLVGICSLVAFISPPPLKVLLIRGEWLNWISLGVEIKHMFEQFGRDGWISWDMRFHKIFQIIFQILLAWQKQNDSLKEFLFSAFKCPHGKCNVHISNSFYITQYCLIGIDWCLKIQWVF